MNRKKSLRMNQLINLINENDSLTVKELAKRLEVSEMTIRRDLNTLKEDDIIETSRGKATLLKNNRVETKYDNYELYSEKIRMNAEKERIGKYAASLIEEGDVITIDTGSTTDKLAKYVPEQMDITVLCYNYNVLSYLVQKPQVDIIFPGGYFHPNGQFFESPQGNEFIEAIRVNKIFLSASGVHESLGITCANNYEVLTKRTALQMAQTRILLTDSSKFSQIRPAYFAQLSELDMIITDEGITEAWQEIIAKHEIELKIV